MAVAEMVFKIPDEMVDKVKDLRKQLEEINTLSERVSGRLVRDMKLVASMSRELKKFTKDLNKIKRGVLS